MAPFLGSRPGLLFGIAGIICGIIALAKIGRSQQRLGGRGFAIAGLACGIGGIVIMVPVALLVAILLPSLSRARELANRSACAANLRGVASSMIIYSSENNDQFPVLPYAAYSSTNAGTSGATGATTADDTIKGLYGASSSQKGSVLAAQWILVLRAQAAPKLYQCKSDPFTGLPGELTDRSGSYYANFQKDNQISYSFAYPYTAKGAVGNWWRNTCDASLPLGADMAPLNGTGNPVRNVAPGSMPSSSKMWNSGNHQGEGENVMFADVHVDFTRRPDVGQSNDNIYSISGRKDVAQYGGKQPDKLGISIYTTEAPFDIGVVPARNLDTGGL